MQIQCESEALQTIVRIQLCLLIRQAKSSLDCLLQQSSRPRNNVQSENNQVTDAQYFGTARNLCRTA